MTGKAPCVGPVWARSEQSRGTPCCEIPWFHTQEPLINRCQQSALRPHSCAGSQAPGTSTGSTKGPQASAGQVSVTPAEIRPPKEPGRAGRPEKVKGSKQVVKRKEMVWHDHPRQTVSGKHTLSTGHVRHFFQENS